MIHIFGHWVIPRNGSSGVDGQFETMVGEAGALAWFREQDFDTAELQLTDEKGAVVDNGKFMLFNGRRAFEFPGDRFVFIDDPEPKLEITSEMKHEDT